MSTIITDLPYTTPTVQTLPQQGPPQTAALPERDIPRNTLEHAADPQTQINYLPPKQPDYIGQSQQVLPAKSGIDYQQLLEDFRVPIMLSLLYFIFQMQLVQGLLQQVLPMLFKVDGNMTTYGLAAKSAMFGSAYYTLTTLMGKMA
jgi:hypothetical protein